MGYIVLAIFLGLVTIGSVAAGFALRSGIRRDYPAARPVLFGAGALFLLFNFLLFAFGGMQTVQVKSIGIPQSFGTVSGGVMSPGVHWTFKPWESVTSVDETVQTTTFEGNNCLSVRIGGQQTACADATIQWQIPQTAAEGLYEDYANQGNLMQTITDAVVVREFKQVVNQVLGDYNPITDVQNVSGSNTATSQFTQFGPTILADMQHDIGARITVKSVFLPKITYDAAVEGALQKIQQANANYSIAVENVKVAQEQSQAYVKLGNPSQNQLVAECLSIVERTGNSNLQCIPGATTNLSMSKG